MDNLSLVDLLEINAINSFKDALEQGADINGQDQYGYTALHKAARGGYRRMVIFLLEQGSLTTIKDNAGYDALFYALMEGHCEIANLLQSYKK